MRLLDASVPMLRATPPEGLRRITRLGHALLGTPVQVVAVSPTSAGLLASSPHEAAPVPLPVAWRLSRAQGVLVVEAGDGTPWAGVAVDGWGRGIHVCLCTTPVTGADRTRAALADLAALASDVLRLDSARDDNAALLELLGTASHDLRNPLSVLRAGLETLTLHRDQLPEGQPERIADLAVRQARRMGGMIDGLLSLTGVEEGAEREELDLRVLARDAVEAGRLCHDFAVFQLAGTLPEEPVTVRGVADSLARVVTNLVSNAAAHGGGQVWVGLDVHATDATLSIADDGPGMPGDSALDTGRRASRGGGHGLGLVIARRIVAAHDGSIGYHDREGGGTVVQLTLPLAG